MGSVTLSGQFNSDGNSPISRNDYTFKILNYGSLYSTVGSHNSDPNVTISGNTVTIESVQTEASTTYSFSIISVAGDYESDPGTPIGHTTPFEPGILQPIMTNFRVEDANPNRVYFDTPLGSVDGILAADFTISGKTITAVDTTNNYFTVSSDFNYFQRGRTIKKTGGNNGVVYDFALRHIRNDMTQPAAVRTRYVSVSGSGSQDGTSESNSWTFAQMKSNYQAGDLIHIKAGNYGSSTHTFSTNGSTSQPVVFQGYKNSPGDISGLYWNYGDGAFLSSEMPLFSGTDRNVGYALDFTGRSGLIFRNLQIDTYQRGFSATSGDNNIIDNCLLQEFGTDGGTNAIGIHTHGENVSHTNTKVVNAQYAGIRHMSTSLYNLVDNCEVWCDEAPDGSGSSLATDYYFSDQGDYNVTINSLAHRVENIQHRGHGFSLDDGGDSPVSNCLQENNVIVNIKQALDLDKIVEDCVFRAIEINDGGYTGLNGGIKLQNDCRNNIFENMRLKGSFSDAHIEMEAITGGDHSGNRFRNCIFESNSTLVGSSADADAFTFENCTFDGITNLGSSLDNTNTFVNCLFNNCANNGSSAVFTNCNSYNGFVLAGGSNSADNPQLTASLAPTNSDLIRAPRITDVFYDLNDFERGSTTTIGALKHADELGDGGAVPPPTEVNVLTNGDFENGSTGWNLAPGWAVSNGLLIATATTTLCSQDVGSGVGQIESGETYKVVIDVKEATTGGIRFRVGGTVDTTGLNSVGDNQEVTGIVAGSDGFFRIDDDLGAVTGKYDNIRLIKTS